MNLCNVMASLILTVSEDTLKMAGAPTTLKDFFFQLMNDKNSKSESILLLFIGMGANSYRYGYFSYRSWCEKAIKL